MRDCARRPTWLAYPPLSEKPAKAKFGKKKMMQLGALVPFHATGGDLVCDYAQCPEATGYDFLAAPEIDTSPPRSWRGFC
jgi:hypothetical protein